ncbi:MAG: hypothetical protein ACI3XM_03715, partial [Eubacteriales bacterium]
MECYDVKNRNAAETALIDLMPYAFRCAYGSDPPPVPLSDQTEIRLRAHGCASVTYTDAEGVTRNHAYPSVRIDEDGLREVLARLCSGSVHAYDEALRRGYFSPADFPGVRIGAAGRVLCEHGTIVRLQKIGVLCIRLPHAYTVSAAEAMRIRGVLTRKDVPIRDEADAIRHTKPENALVSTLFFAPPGEGKTTLLRAVIRILSGVHTDAWGDRQPPMRAAVIDTGEELYRESPIPCLADYFFGYPRGAGIAIATRAFSPEVILCDEIGDEADAEDILRTQAAGIPLIATAHADSLPELLLRPCMRRLYDNRVFRRYIRV